MQAWPVEPNGTSRAQLPEGSTAIQKMENLLFTLKSDSAPWLSPSSTAWVVEITLAFLGGVGLFLLLLPCLQKDGSLPSNRKKRNMRKHRVETRSSRSRKSGALQGKALPFHWSSGACTDVPGQLKEVRGLISRLQSHLAEIPDPPTEVCKPAPARAHQTCTQNVENTAPATLSPLAALAPLAEHPLPVASTLSPGPTSSVASVGSYSPLSVSQPPEPSLPVDTLSTRPPVLPPPPSRPPDPVASHLPPADSSRATSPIPAISTLSHPSCPISALSWWQVAAKALCFPTSSQDKSQQEGLSHSPKEALFSGEPTHRNMEAGGPSLVDPKAQEVLEILITKRAGQKIWNDKQKKESDYHLDSLRNRLKSSGDEQDTRTPQPFWTMKDKPGQLPGPQQLSDPKVLQGHLQKKHSQLFWGLPFLHSESLVATIRVSGSPLEFPSVLFNELSEGFPVQIQTQLSPPSRPHMSLDLMQPQDLQQRYTQHCCGLSHRPHMSLDLMQPQDLQQRYTQHCCGLSHRPHMSLDLMQPQDLQQRYTQHCCGLSHRPHMSLDLMQPQDLQQRYTQHCCGLSHRPHMSLDLMQPQDEFPGTSQVKDRHGPSVFIGGSSQNMQRMESRGPVKVQLGKIPSKDPKHSLGRVVEDLPRASESNSWKVPGANTEKKSEKEWMRPLGSDSGKDSTRSSDMKHLEDTAEVLLHRKVGEVNEDMVPMGVHHPSLANGHVLSLENSNTHMETGNIVPSKGKVSHVNTSQQLSFLDVHTRQVLEAHIKRFQARHEWGPTLKVHKPPHLLKGQKAQPLSLPQPAFPSSANSESGAKSTAEAANVPGVPPHKDPGEKVAGKTSLSTPCRPLPVPLPVCKEAQGSAYKPETPPGDKSRPSEGPPTGQEDRWPSQPLICNVMGTTWHSANVLGAGTCSLELSPSPAMSRGSQGQQEPRNPTFQNLQKRPSKMFGPTGKREGRRRPAQGRHEQTLTELSPPAQDRESVESLSSQSSQLLPGKGQASPESHFRKRIRRFLQWIVPSEKRKGQKDPLQKDKPASAPGRSRGQVLTGLLEDNCVAEAQVLMTTVGQILEEKMGLHHGLSASTAPVGGHSCHHRGPSYPEQRPVVRGMVCSHHATAMGHSHPVKYRWIRDGDSSGASLPRERVSPASPCRHRPLLVRASGCSIHCPRHCRLQRGVWSGQPDHASHLFPGGKGFPHEKLPFSQRKPVFPNVGTPCVC
ncbi:PREDICTED: spermatogenesis-associated protein 31E1-like [Galeopterus variegatus]|uniref:Spermatogenesis-associated protein 31E1-like n=1 Tax=Galeopterus variegatus TaxID=482537 RepID=A0ABM0RWQ4_GALVR|nr:PREDICTED: spermatogenesis-associated protein 31E1-like [Galeopterus variegatus]